MPSAFNLRKEFSLASLRVILGYLKFLKFGGLDYEVTIFDPDPQFFHYPRPY
jgi:hypothetical protein